MNEQVIQKFSTPIGMISKQVSIRFLSQDVTSQSTLPFENILPWPGCKFPILLHKCPLVIRNSLQISSHFYEKLLIFTNHNHQLCSNLQTWAQDVRLHIVDVQEAESVQFLQEENKMVEDASRYTMSALDHIRVILKRYKNISQSS